MENKIEQFTEADVISAWKRIFKGRETLNIAKFLTISRPIIIRGAHTISYNVENQYRFDWLTAESNKDVVNMLERNIRKELGDDSIKIVFYQQSRIDKIFQEGKEREKLVEWLGAEKKIKRRMSIIAAIIVSLIIWLSYLFLLNGRYANIDGKAFVFDKWRCEYREVPYKFHGEPKFWRH